MQHNYFRNFLIVSILLSAGLLACDKKQLEQKSPAQHIAESEQLVIPAAIDVPANLPNGNTRVATYFAEGVQKYKGQKKSGSDPVMYEWVFVAPQADLYDASNKKIGTHSAGPTWQLTGSADSIYGQQFAPPKFVNVDPFSIDWLQLQPKSGKPPTGIFSNVAYIQRIATKGGKAPTTLPKYVGQIIDVPYTAIYRFIKKN